MFQISVLAALTILLPLIGYPVLIILQLIVETPVLRREPATELRRAAATVLAIISLLAAAPR
ncbi:hypothetical protein [Kocuria nitroreducens]|uniref:hypothetical protein n=1 Tax=Kocuria nitroreducens TaxID=3058914 RepID=UPI0036DD051F